MILLAVALAVSPGVVGFLGSVGGEGACESRAMACGCGCAAEDGGERECLCCCGGGEGDGKSPGDSPRRGGERGGVEVLLTAMTGNGDLAGVLWPRDGDGEVGVGARSLGERVMGGPMASAKFAALCVWRT